MQKLSRLDFREDQFKWLHVGVHATNCLLFRSLLFLCSYVSANPHYVSHNTKVYRDTFYYDITTTEVGKKYDIGHLIDVAGVLASHLAKVLVDLERLHEANLSWRQYIVCKRIL